MVYRLLMAAVLIFAAADVVLADVVVLKDGRKLEGKIVKETESTLTLRMKYGEVEYRLSQVASVERCPTAQEEYEKKAGEVEKTAGAHYRLGRWCARKGLHEEARKHYKRALEIDGSYTPAGRALRYEKVDGKWLPRAEAREARGLVKFEGKWITRQKRDKILLERDSVRQDQYRKEYDVGPEFFVMKRKAHVLVSDLPVEKRLKLLAAAAALYAAIERRFRRFFVKGRNDPMVVFAFSKREDYRKRVEKDGIDAALESFGYYSGPRRRVYLFECAVPTIVRMLQHECTHQIYVERMMERGVRSHHWIFEGLAEYYEGFDFNGEKLSEPRPHTVNLAEAKRAAKEGKLFPCEKMIETKDLSELFGGDFASEDCKMAYAQAWAMVYYLLEGDGGRHRSKFERFMKKDLKGKGEPSEFKKIFGSNLKKFQEKIVNFLKKCE